MRNRPNSKSKLKRQLYIAGILLGLTAWVGLILLYALNAIPALVALSGLALMFCAVFVGVVFVQLGRFRGREK